MTCLTVNSLSYANLLEIFINIQVQNAHTKMVDSYKDGRGLYEYSGPASSFCSYSLLVLAVPQHHFLQIKK